MILDLSLRNNNPYSIGNIFMFLEGDAVLERQPIFYKRTSPDKYHVITEGETLGSIAFQYYNNSKEWWILMDVNKIQQPFDLTPGMVLLIPDINKINLVR